MLCANVIVNRHILQKLETAEIESTDVHQVLPRQILVYGCAMAALLERAIEEASTLPEKEQEAIGALILEEISDFHAYDTLRDRAHSEIAVGQFVKLTSYRARQKRKAK